MASYGKFTSKLTAVNQLLSTIGQARVTSLQDEGEAHDAQLVLEEIDKAVQLEGWHFNMFPNVELSKGVEQMGISEVNGAIITTSNNHQLLVGDTVTIETEVAGVFEDLKVASLNPVTPTIATLDAVVDDPWATSFIYTHRISTPTSALNVDFSRYKYSDIDPVVRGKFLYDRYNGTYEFAENCKAIITYQIDFEQDEEGGTSLPEYARRYISMRAARVFAQRHVGDPTLIQQAVVEETLAHNAFVQVEAENADTNIFSSALPYATISRGGIVQPTPLTYSQ